MGRVKGIILLPTHNAHFSDVSDLMRGNGRQCFYEGGHVLTSVAAHFEPGVCCTCWTACVFLVPGVRSSLCFFFFMDKAATVFIFNLGAV